MTWRADHGAATVWVLGFGAVIVAVAMVVTTRGTAVLARHRLERAADLAALAGAQQIGHAAQPCAAASRIAAANAATLVSCTAELGTTGRSGTVAVTLRRAVSLPLIGGRVLSARARADRLPSTGTSAPGPGRRAHGGLTRLGCGHSWCRARPAGSTIASTVLPSWY
jgi:secretion/DNA translocation related TadE-like protein